MAHEELGFGRSDIYSAWHRRLSIQRYVGMEDAESLGMIDVDAALWIEYHNGSKEPVVLIETARDVGQNIKPVTVLKALARRLHPIVPAYLLLYTPSARLNPAADGVPDIEWFRYKRIWPDPEIGWLFAKPQDWAYHLLCLRQQYSISGNTRRLGAA